jgi:CRP-like cAMP-binding protein
MNFYDYLEIFEYNNQHQSHLIEELNARLRNEHIDKGTYLLRPGEICKYAYVVESGFFRYFEIQFEEEVTTGFAGEKELAFSLPSLLLLKPSNTGIVCEADAKVLKISTYEWQALEDLSPAILQLSKQLLNQQLLDCYSTFQQLRNATTIRKYQYLCERYKGFSNLVSQRKIASFLGITPPALSALLKDLLRKH